jgi:hypothetical protein
MADLMKVLLIFLLFLTHLLMSYGGSALPLRALLGSLLIGWFARMIWPAEWKDWLGLRIPRQAVMVAAALAPIAMILLYFFIRMIANAQNIIYRSPVAEHGIFSLVYFHTLGQTLNEEMLLGAVLINAFRRKIGKFHSFWIVMIIAASFAFMHYVFYRWIVRPEFAGKLAVGVLFVLFALGALRNTLIIKTGHIAYSWSLHFSINCVGLLGLYAFANGEELLEPQVFNLILGSDVAVVLSTIVLAACGVVLYYSEESPKTPAGSNRGFI